MKIFRKSKGFLIFCALSFIILLKLMTNYRTNTPKINEMHRPLGIHLNSCPIPVYEKYSRSLSDGFPLKKIQCVNDTDLVMIKNGNVNILKGRSCIYQCIFWKTDFDYKLGNVEILTNSQNVPCQYFLIKCENNKTNSKDTQLIMTALKNETFIKSSKSILNGSTKLRDVLILGIDSMSYLAYKHYLPKIFNVLHNELNGISFTKFNTMGDGTTVNLQGLLTGTKDTETYEARRRVSGAKTVDDYNWIWRHYKERGYLTQYYEEMTDYGTFQYRLLGFNNQPTDIYLRTFLMYAERTKISKSFCLGNVPQHLEILRFYKEVIKAYEEMPTFSFLYYGVTSHDDNKYSSYLDNDIAKFLIELRKQKPNIMIILYADHGHRFSSRLSMQGKYEERLPFLGISLPEDLKHLHNIVKSNSEVLISGLDVHATLEDILGIYKPQIRNRHMSLLRPLPKDRSCRDIESAPHWCACLNWMEISEPNLDQRLVKISEKVVNEIVNFTLNDRELCAELKLDKIISIYKLKANKDVLKFKQSADVDGFVPDLSDETLESDLWFRVTLETKPGDAIFEVTILLKAESFNDISNVKINKFLPNDVSRINRYAPWIKCLQKIRNKKNTISDIRKFCICKNTL